MPIHRTLALIALLAATLPRASAAEAAPLRLQSPDGKAVVELSLDEGGHAHYAVAWNGQPVLLPSPLGVQLGEDDRIERGLRIVASRRSESDSTYALVAGKASRVRDHYRQMEVDLADTQGRRLGLVVRAYDDGIALRYRLPLPAQGDLVVKEELTGFVFPRDYACWALNLGRFGTSHEGEYDPIAASRLRPHHLIELPLVCGTGQGTATLAIAEADLDRYAGMYLSGRGDGRLGVEARLSPRLDTPQLAVRLPRGEVARDGHLTPWRVLMLGDGPGALVESNLISSLNPPTPIEDTSWIRPGKTAWDWWSGGLAPDVPEPGMNTATIRRYIDHAAALKLEYMLIDDGWYAGSTGNGRYNEDADITRPIPQLDLPGLIEYARQRGVGIWVWAHWRSLEPRMDAVFAQYARMGVKGVKVDFMDRDDQQMVEFFHRMMRSSARHRLMLNLHGAYRPTGLARTWPQYLTQEGVLGAENNKWSRRITPTHNLVLPFTRMLLGPMDYTPGGFRNATPEAFQVHFQGPQVMGTRAHQLAMFVVYESPLQMVADSPDVYVDAAGADFIAAVPATWDETRVLAGEIGRYIVVARRAGEDWYIGAMTDETARTLEVPLDFLADAGHRATLWHDGQAPTDVRREERRIDAGHRTLKLDLSPSGGAAVRLTR
ncbi:alpha-glucosidase [Pseudoxanthomonas broegbernensis]|uniref:Alpha-glucosidase n=1 Tax=Pseudoxanthomonas broegbernensis TaxID=83619 RepID=A0A7V8K869_9GAMM|nr:glycoside hydrolase family 97 protein [Pseudoxanthomonas broegbernensis]KAF1687341.1 alpha-glucosidase [Pseudoxanthomonas broegbernensis]MBB6065658.1 alpha-glucosidase [Pseudoxanthomonas broegbernensis]